MDLHRPSSCAPVCDAEQTLARPVCSRADFEARIAARRDEEQALEALEARITQLWGHINAATAQFLALLAEFDRRGGWAQEGITSCSHWLNWQCGISRVAAREKVRTARALESLPKIAAAFGEGRLSYSKVRALTRVATSATEDTLLHIALNGTAAHVERTVRGFRRVRRHLERDEAEAMHERCYLNCRRESDGSVRVEARLAPEVGEMLIKALEAAEAELDKRGAEADKAGASALEGVSAETPPAHCLRPQRLGISQRRADALAYIVERFVSGTCSGSTGSALEVVVHIPHDALCDVPESAGASFEHGGPVAVETARRLSCDGALVGVVKGAKGEPLAVGRRTRAVPPAIRRALRVRDGGCRFPGCDRSRYVHAHHIRHWADGGETRLDNLVTLCSQHHRQVHEGGYDVRIHEDEIRFFRPDGREIPPAGKPQEGCFRGNTSRANGAQRLAAYNAGRGIEIDAQTARCRWGGERMDYDIAIDGLCWQEGSR